MDACRDSIGDAQVFSTLHTSSVFSQMQMKALDPEMTCFQTHISVFQCPLMQFGLSNGPEALYNVLEIALSTVTCQQFPIYFDNVFLFSQSMEHHVENGLIILRAVGTALKWSKCVFFQEEIYCLGHTLILGKLATEVDVNDTVHRAPFPSDPAGLKSLVGA